MEIQVRKLEWPPNCPRGRRVHSRANALIRYCIAHYGGDVGDDTIYRWASEGEKWSEPFASYESAQVAAQGDYDDRVRTEIILMGWKPIETAPKENPEWVFLFVPGHGPARAIWRRKRKWWESHTSGKEITAATHWMQLPTPPLASRSAS